MSAHQKVLLSVDTATRAHRSVTNPRRSLTPARRLTPAWRRMPTGVNRPVLHQRARSDRHIVLWTRAQWATGLSSSADPETWSVGCEAITGLGRAATATAAAADLQVLDVAFTRRLDSPQLDAATWTGVHRPHPVRARRRGRVGRGRCEDC